MRDIRFRAWDKCYRRMVDVDELHIKSGKIRYAKGFNTLVRFALMQYTGLKDKNGVEIYEGDVVRHDDGWTSAVRWDDFLTGFYPFHFDIDKELFLSSWEVIGNIYAREE